MPIGVHLGKKSLRIDDRSPVVQSIINLTNTLRGQHVKSFTTLLPKKKKKKTKEKIWLVGCFWA